MMLGGGFLALGLVWSAQAQADNDWLGIEVPRPIDSGKFSFNVSLDQTEKQYWADGYTGYFMVDASDGQVNQVKFQDLITINTRLEWRVEPRLVLQADVPTVFSEFSPATPGTVQYYSVNTPGVEESQGLGDVRLGLRGTLKDKGEGFNAGCTLFLVAPTGLSPFSAPQTLAATGEGRWQALPGFVLGGESGAWEGWWQVTGCYQFGQQVESSSDAYLDWKSQVISQGLIVESVNNTSLPNGGAWLGPRYGADSVAGLGWIWYRDADSKMELALEAKAHWLSPWTTAAGSIGLPPEEYFVLTPELQAHYGRYSAIAGWQAQYFWAMEEPVAPYGEIMFDVAYTY